MNKLLSQKTKSTIFDTFCSLPLIPETQYSSIWHMRKKRGMPTMQFPKQIHQVELSVLYNLIILGLKIISVFTVQRAYAWQEKCKISFRKVPVIMQ